MVVLNIYGIIMFIPLVFAVIWMFVEHKPFLTSLKDEYYLFIGYSILYFAVYLVINFLIRSALLVEAATIIYLILYFVLQFVRHFVVSDTYDMNERMKDVKLLGK
jgi:hypothetical protein